MELVQREMAVVVGVPVTARFDELSTAVPAAWTQLFERRDELPAPTNDLYAEASFSLADGRYHETVGVPLEPQTLRVDGPWSFAFLPAGSWVHHRCTRPVEEIGLAFADIYDWAVAEGLILGHRKLDVGYRADGAPAPHDLYIDVVD